MCLFDLISSHQELNFVSGPGEVRPLNSLLYYVPLSEAILCRGSVQSGMHLLEFHTDYGKSSITKINVKTELNQLLSTHFTNLN